MSALDQIVNIVITQQTKAVPQPSFGIPLIVGPTGFGNADVIRAYSSPDAMLDDGFTTSSIEYIYAVAAFSQDLSPELIYVGKRVAVVAQVDTITPTAVNSHLYKVTINGTDYSYTSDGSTTVSEIVAGLLALVNADTSLAVTASGSSTLILTADVAGDGFTTSINADVNLALVHTTANHGIATDLAAILDDPNGANWYGLVLCSNTAADIKQAAAYIESQKKIFVAASGDSAIATGATTDVASVLKGLGYKRTALMFSPVSYNLGMDAAWVGGQLPQVPGASTWKFKSLTGILPDFFTAAKRTILIGVPGVSVGKGVNIYETVGGVNITEEGWMVGGQFIDITIGLDELESALQTNIYSMLVNNPKIPYTDKGIAVIENAVQQTLKQRSDDGGTGFLDATTIAITVKAAADIPANTRAQRILPQNAIKFTARLTGAFHFININGVVSV